MMAVPDATNQSTLWLEHLYGNAEDGWLTLFAQDRTSGDRHTCWQSVSDIDALVIDADALASRCCVWFGVGVRRERVVGRGTASDVVSFPGLWLDIDVASAGWHKRTDLPPTIDEGRQLLTEFPLEPTAVIHTGGGLQAWWLFDELQEADRVTPLLDGWAFTWQSIAAAHGWHIDSVFDAARVMRLPGTFNLKGADPLPVTITDVTWDRRYGLDDIEQWLIPMPERPAAPEPRTPYVGPERPGDAFNLTHHGGADILVGVGFQLHHRDRNGDEHYSGPWKTVREGASATVYADDGHTTIWSDTALQRWPTLQVRRPYDPFGLYAHIHHHGDFTAASDDLAARGYGSKGMIDDLSWAVIEPAAVVLDEEAILEAGAWIKADQDLIRLILSDAYVRPEPTLLQRTDGIGLLYPGKVHSLAGEPGAGKTWVALMAVLEALCRGEQAMLIDWEDHADTAHQRLRSLGATDEQMLEQFHYITPGMSAKGGSVPTWIVDLAAGCSLVVIDSVGEAMADVGVGQNDDDAVALWGRRVTRAIAREGCTVLQLDHVIKDAESRGRWAIGSQRKLAAIDGAAYNAITIKPFTKTIAGSLKLTVAKDRGGNFATGSTVAIVGIDPSDGTMNVTISPDMSHDDHGEFMPTGMMERASRILEAGGEMNRNALLGASQGIGKTTPSVLRQAVDKLVELDHVAVRPGPRGSTLHTSLNPYREPELGLTDNRDSTEISPRLIAVESTAIFPPSPTGEIAVRQSSDPSQEKPTAIFRVPLI